MQKEIGNGRQAGKKLEAPAEEPTGLARSTPSGPFTNDEPCAPTDFSNPKKPTRSDETTHSVVRDRGTRTTGSALTNCIQLVDCVEDVNVGSDDPLLEHYAHSDIAQPVSDAEIPHHVTASSAPRSILPAFPCPRGELPDDSSCARPSVSGCFSEGRPNEAEMYRRAISVDRPNYRGAQVPVNHQLNIDKWEQYRHLLPDTTLVEMLHYGFPAGYTGTDPPLTGLQNHSSATRNPTHVDKYLNTELSHEALLGPFPSDPFSEWFHTNPAMTRPKKDSDDFRVILDLSFPDGASVNHHVPQHTLDYSDFKFQLPTPDLLANRIIQLGQGCLLYKADLSRAYRQLRSDPRDWPLLGIRWADQVYIDTAIPFGLRHGASACQRTSEAVITIANHLYGMWALPYIDDTAGAATPEEADLKFTGLRRVMDLLGLQTADHKCQSPATSMDWIGVHFDMVQMTMHIAKDKITEATNLCAGFLQADSISKKELQSMVGKVMHTIKCTLPARRFTSRLLDLLKGAVTGRAIPITHAAKMDVRWLHTFLARFNGKTLIKPLTAQVVAYVDACPTGIGAYSPGYGYYGAELGDAYRQCNFSISSTECFNILVAVRVWIQQWAGKVVLLYSDNWSAVCAAHSGRAQDPLIRAAIRELWWLCALHDTNLIIRHRPGAQMQDADTLSRLALDHQYTQRFADFQQRATGQRVFLAAHHTAPPVPI